MFKQRLLTTLILGPAVLLLLCYAPPIVVMGLILMLLLVCGIEWLNLIPIQHRLIQVVYLISLLLISWVIQYEFRYWLIIGLIFWGLIFVAILYFPASKSIWGYSWVVSLLGLVVLPLFAHSLFKTYQQNHGLALVIDLLLIVWAADIGAYLVGKQWGRHKLITAVSPGKTIEGSFGGILLAMLLALILYFYLKPVPFIVWLIAAIATILFAIIGDLFISMLKRRVNLKDTGQILPGHGGILDRVDSLIAAAPFYYGILFLFPGLQI